MALPVGFLNTNETTRQGAIRELKEETSIKLSKEVLISKIVGEKVFDHPTRSSRGRTVSFSFLLDLGLGDLPKVKGDDDASKAFWLPINEIIQRENEFFEDHFYMIQYYFMKM